MKWEYDFVFVSRERITGYLKMYDTLDDYGKTGWELVSALDKKNETGDEVYLLIFKRPINVPS